MTSYSGLAGRLKQGTDLAEMGPDCYSLHGADGKAHYVNANALDLFGCRPDELLGDGFLSQIQVLDRVGAACAISDCLAEGTEKNVQFRVQRAHGPLEPTQGRWYLMHCRPSDAVIEGVEGRLALVVTRDISERRMLEDELRIAREKAESLSIAKSRFLASTSHELRTPLNAILGFSELMQSSAMDRMPAGRRQEYVGLIHNSATHLLNVLNDILDMSKIEAGKYEIVPEPFDLATALTGCCAMMRGQAQTREIELVTSDLVDLPEIIADERAIKQVVINLLSNAVKFAETGGRVEVTASRVGRNVMIAVADDGIGISPEHMASLGQPFYQADSKYDRKYEGTGLGLSVVCGLVELHGGKVEFDSHKGKGTTVTVTLPINSGEARPVPASEKIEVLELTRDRDDRDFTITRRAV
ncbi:MAG: PAS domain-containing sensor histidine kinase [Salaquimonas sp.]|nr:PAS domain-containing sensor histidine kinase [Salaquimonas sp.]